MFTEKNRLITETCKFNVRTLLIVVSFFTLIYIILSFTIGTFIRMYLLHDVSSQIDWLSERVKNDIRYMNGQWDISLYLSDPFTPYPAGNGGFGHPLYVITKEGFVIERNLPINGLLDTSALDKILRFQNPTTIHALTNEEWRILSRPIKSNNKIVGAILIAQLKPNNTSLTEVDKHLINNSNKIAYAISITNGVIDTTFIDPLKIDYDLSFEVVDKNDKILLNNGRVPTYIDSDRVQAQFNAPTKQTIYDSVLKKNFLIKTKTIYDTHNKPVGIIIHGQSLQLIENLIKNYILFTTILYIILIIPISVIAYLTTLRYFERRISSDFQPKVGNIQFNAGSRQLHIDQKIIELPGGSNIYKMCELLFTDPQKSWSQETFFKLFNTSNWRSVYDAFLTINRKAAIKLILHQDKSYFLNPKYTSNIITPVK